MGSPYHVHTFNNNISVVRSEKGFAKILNQVFGTMGKIVSFSNILDVLTHHRELQENGGGPEWAVLHKLLGDLHRAVKGSKRVVVFLEARYEWHGWEKFQRVIVLDFTKSDTRPVSPSLVTFASISDDDLGEYSSADLVLAFIRSMPWEVVDFRLASDTFSQSLLESKWLKDLASS